MTPTTKELRKHLLASAIDAGAPADLMRRADAWLDKWQPVIEREAAAEAEALRAERDRLRKALTSIAEFSNEPEAMMAADALATPAPAAPAAASERKYDEADDMCPNCQTPWKCNGPHFPEFTPRYQTAPAAPAEPECDCGAEGSRWFHTPACASFAPAEPER